MPATVVFTPAHAAVVLDERTTFYRCVTPKCLVEKAIQRHESPIACPPAVASHRHSCDTRARTRVIAGAGESPERLASVLAGRYVHFCPAAGSRRCLIAACHHFGLSAFHPRWGAMHPPQVASRRPRPGSRAPDVSGIVSGGQQQIGRHGDQPNQRIVYLQVRDALPPRTVSDSACFAMRQSGSKGEIWGGSTNSSASADSTTRANPLRCNVYESGSPGARTPNLRIKGLRSALVAERESRQYQRLSYR